MVSYLFGNAEADKIVADIKRTYQGSKAKLAVKGTGPFRRQIERMAKGASVEVVEYPFPEVGMPYDVDVVNSRNICDFFTHPDFNEDPPCVVEAIDMLIATSGSPTWDITVLGRGRFGAFTATYLARQYERVRWQSASWPIEGEGIIVNCSREAPESYPDGSIVIDINKIGRLTTAILLLRTAERGYGEIKI